jgi:hypothetical protein
VQRLQLALHWQPEPHLQRVLQLLLARLQVQHWRQVLRLLLELLPKLALFPLNWH